MELDIVPMCTTQKKGILVHIHGVSGSGKSTIGKELLKQLECVWIDQDTYYRKEKPLVVFSNQRSPFSEGEGIISYVAENWDSEESIDFNAFNDYIDKMLYQSKCVIVTGFALRLTRMKAKPDFSFILTFDDFDDNTIIRLITDSRLNSKKFSTEEKRQKDYWMVRNVLWPFYQQTLKLIGRPVRINTCFLENFSIRRIAPNVIAQKIIVYMNLNKSYSRFG